MNSKPHAERNSVFQEVIQEMKLITQWDSLNSMSWINNDTFLTAFYVVTPLILFSLLISFAKLEARLVHSAKAFHNVLWGYCAVWICLLLSAYFQLCELIHANKFYYRALGLAKICGKNAVAKLNLDNFFKKKSKTRLDLSSVKPLHRKSKVLFSKSLQITPVAPDPFSLQEWLESVAIFLQSSETRKLSTFPAQSTAKSRISKSLVS